jgi:hypothetical protein
MAVYVTDATESTLIHKTNSIYDTFQAEKEVKTED